MSLLGFSASSPVSTLLPALLWCTACSWALFSPEGGSTGDLRSVNSTKPPKGRVSPNAACTLSSSENSIRSSGVQLRPMGEMFSIPLRNSMKVPLCGQEHKVTGGIYRGWERNKKAFPGKRLLSEACSVCRDMQEERSHAHSWVLVLQLCTSF